MLQKVFIKNFALLEEAEISFSPGFNVLTGETGAGKSLVINALNSILGEKVSTDILRPGAEKAVVEGIFANSPAEIEQSLEENQIDNFKDALHLRRELNQSGRSRTFINDCLTHIDLLKQISSRLVDLHGQHEHQSLLNEENHLRFLDEFGALEQEITAVQKLHAEHNKLQHQLDYLQKNAQKLREKRDFLQFQIQEIETLNLDASEEEELEKEEKILENYEKLVEGCNQIYLSLYEDESSVYSRLGTAIENLQDLAGIDGAFSEFISQLSNAYIQVEEVARFLSQYTSRTDFEPERLEEIRVRLGQIARLKKKYGLPLAEILTRHEENKREIAQVENLDEEIATLEKLLKQKKSELQSACEKLTESRQLIAGELEKQIEDVLHRIGMENAQFRVHFDYHLQADEAGIFLPNGFVAKANGQDKISYHVATNPGAGFLPLVKIASGGELSRIMLAIKSVVAERDQIGVLVFDEIDIGISGRIAEAVGKQLKELSHMHQIICVTHLPQIARFADRHYSVRKEVKNGETFAFIRELSFEQRIHELAYLLGGEQITETVLKNAEELLAG